MRKINATIQLICRVYPASSQEQSIRQFCEEFGIGRSTVFSWGNDPPRIVLAYLELADSANYAAL